MTAWTFEPSIVLGLVGLALVYTLALTRLGWSASPAQILAFGAGLLTLALALLSPLDAFADHILFSAHMLQHLLLLLVVPLFLLLGLPDAAFARAWQAPPLRALLKLLAPPLPTFLLSLLVLWLWHVPTIYEAALLDETLHACEHLCFLASAFLFWWPIVRPATYPWPMPELVQLLYLFGAAVSSTMLAALITFSADLLYPSYAAIGRFAAVRDSLGLTPLTDQQAGGLMMWIGGGLWYFGAGGVVFARMFSSPVDDRQAGEASNLQDNGVTT